MQNVRVTRRRLKEIKSYKKIKGNLYEVIIDDEKVNLYDDIIIKFSLLLKKEIDKKVKELINYRKTNHPLSLPSAGSVFVNPEIKITNKKLLAQYPELSEFAKKGYIHSGFLIEKCGLKGKRIGGAKISEKHGNFIVNCGNAKAKDVAALINLAKRKVKNRFGINLETEIQIVK